MNGNFNATDLAQIYDILEDMQRAFNQLEYAGCGGTEKYPGYDISSLIGSDDSGLSSSWDNSRDAVCAFSDTAKALLLKIRDEFESYIRNTISNEENAVSALNVINKALEEDIQLLSKIEI